MKVLIKILSDESGQGMVEYSLVLSLVALAAIVAVIMFGYSVKDLYENIKVDLEKAL